MVDILKRLILRNRAEQLMPQVFMSEEQLSNFFKTYGVISDVSNRVETYLKNEWKNEVSITDLADAGFCCYQFENKNQVVCFSCRGTIANWENGDIPLKVHKKVYPRCQYARSKARGMKRKSTQFDNPGMEADNDITDEIDDMHFFKSEFNRLMSFKRWPLSSFVDRYDLASAGFYCIDETKTVICVGCFVEVSDWSLGDRPQSKHIERDGKPCPFAYKQKEEKAIEKVEIQQFIRSECAVALKEE